jgi:hypothetical protein
MKRETPLDYKLFQFIHLRQFIVRQTEREIVFRVPLTPRLLLAPFAVCFWVCTCFACDWLKTAKGSGDAFSIAFALLFSFLLAALLSYGCLPHSLRLDFMRHEYEEAVGAFPWKYVWSGSFGDIHSVFVEESPGLPNSYRVGLIWQGRRTRRWFSFTDGRYRFATTENKGEAAAFAQNMADRNGRSDRCAIRRDNTALRPQPMNMVSDYSVMAMAAMASKSRTSSA